MNFIKADSHWHCYSQGWLWLCVRLCRALSQPCPDDGTFRSLVSLRLTHTASLRRYRLFRPGSWPLTGLAFPLAGWRRWTTKAPPRKPQDSRLSGVAPGPSAACLGVQVTLYDEGKVTVFTKQGALKAGWQPWQPDFSVPEWVSAGTPTSPDRQGHCSSLRRKAPWSGAMASWRPASSVLHYRRHWTRFQADLRDVKACWLHCPVPPSFLRHRESRGCIYDEDSAQGQLSDFELRNEGG